MQKDVKRVPLPIHEEIVEETKKPTMALVRYFERIISLISDRMRWLGYYTVNQQYYRNDVVRDGNWTMIANKDTSQRPAPQPQGDPAYVFQGTMATITATAKQLIFGARYTLSQAGFINGYRIYTYADQDYNIFIVRGDSGEIESLLSIKGASTGWKNFSVSPTIIPIGTSFDLVAIVTEPDPTPTIWTADYDYVTPNNAGSPSAGQMLHATRDVGVVKVSKTDANLGDRETELAALTVGDSFSGAGVEWTIQSISDDGAFFTFGVSPATQGIQGEYLFSFETVTATPISYAIDTNYYSAIPQVSGLYIADGDYADIVENNNAYGVDILYQDALISEDWDILAHST